MDTTIANIGVVRDNQYWLCVKVLGEEIPADIWDVIDTAMINSSLEIGNEKVICIHLYIYYCNSHGAINIELMY